jgi:hypothetical protein
MNMIIKSGIVALVALILRASPLAATELFVDQKHPAADDKNPGTEAKPFKTIQPAVDVAKSADVIYIKAGVYSDTVRVKGFGRPGHPTIMTAWKDDRVVIGSELKELSHPQDVLHQPRLGTHQICVPRQVKVVEADISERARQRVAELAHDTDMRIKRELSGSGPGVRRTGLGGSPMVFV